MPVRRMSLGSRGTWLSGVLRSSLSMPLGGLVGGGSGYRGFDGNGIGKSLALLDVIVDNSDASSPLSSDSGEASCNRMDVSGNSVPGF